MRFHRVDLESLVAEKLSDGSIAIFDPRTRSVHSLNPSAAVIWEACAEAVSVAEIAATLETHFGRPVDDEVVQAAIQQLRMAHLIASDESAPVPVLNLDRRSWMKALVAALPAVLTFSPLPMLAENPPAQQPTTRSATPRSKGSPEPPRPTRSPEPPRTTRPPRATEPPRTTRPRTTEPPRTTRPGTTAPPRTTRPGTAAPPRTTRPGTAAPSRTTRPTTTAKPGGVSNLIENPLIQHRVQIGSRKV